MTAGVTHAGYGVTCPHCGGTHQTTCQRISAIEFASDGATVTRIEFHAPAPPAEQLRAVARVGNDVLYYSSGTEKAS